jgi:tetratricopeptide (TPR) repeat protein
MIRRVAVAVIALAIAALIFRPQIADALVARGDDLLYKNARDRALLHYARALAFDPASGTAADRYVFVSMERHTRASLGDALAVANAYLRSHPGDSSVLNDRALCYLVLRQYRNAARDFELAARSGGGGRDDLFARLASRAAAR